MAVRKRGGGLGPGRKEVIRASKLILLVAALLACTTAFAVAEELPGAADLKEGLEQLEREEAQRRLQLEAPAAVQARQTSRLAYTGHDSAPAAAALVRSVFADQLAAMNQDPARFLSDAVIEANLGATTARVSLDRGEALLDAGIPLKTKDELGRLRPVDLTLQPTGDGYVLANPLVDLGISRLADSGILIAVAGEEVGIRPVGVDGDVTPEPFGSKNVLFPSVQTDRDLLVSPISRGVELSDQLRSVNSPEALRYEVDLPAGATLREDGNGGAEIAIGNETHLRVPFPTAVDAQGSTVPVKLTVEGSSLILRIPHRTRPVAYPILVDPIFELVEGWNWLGGANLQALSDGSWQWGSNVGWIHGRTSCINTCWGSGHGLFISTPNGAFAAGQFGQWTYTPPGETSYVTGAALHSFFRNNHNCSKAQAPQPHDYDGLWNPSGWNVLQINRANDFGNAQLSGAGRVLVVGLGTGNAGANSCWRDIVLGAATVWITDPDNPSWHGAPGIADSWTDTAVQPISVSAGDPGLGVKYFNLFTTDGSGNPVSLIGHAVHPCTGLRASPCPGSWSTQITNYNPAVLPTGILPLALRAYDPLPDTHFAGQAVFLKVDHNAPVINFSGDLLSAHPIKYHLEVEAEDGSAAALSSAQSGMKKIDFFLDGERQGAFPEANPPDCLKMDQGINVGSCKFKDIALDLPRWMEGKHSLKVVATDSLGHQTTKTLNLDLPRDTSPPELVASGPLRPPTGRWIAPNGLTLSVQAKDLETGVARATVFVDGEEVTQPFEQECEFGGCDLNHTFDVSLEGYEHGLHDVKVVATDVAGNSTQDSWTVRLDTRPPTLDVSLAPNPAPETPGGWFPQPSGLPVNFTASDNGDGTPGSGIAKVETVQPFVTNPQPLVLFSGEGCGSTENPCPQEAQGKKGLGTVPFFRQGEFEVPVKVYDVAGNVTTKTVTLRLDRSSPNATVTGPIFQAPLGTTIPADTEVDLAVTDKGSGIRELEVFVDGNVVQAMAIEEMEADGATQTCIHETCTLDYSFVPDVGDSLPSGIHTFEVRVKDRANRTSSRKREMMFDTRPPTLDVSLAPNPAPETPGGWFPQPFGLPVSFAASDNGDGTPGSGIAKVETVQPLFQNPQTPLVLFSGEGCGSTESPCPQEAQGKKGLHPVFVLRQGEFEIPVRAYDVAGNVTTKTLTLRLDHQPPDLTATGPIFQTPAGTAVSGNTEVDLAVTDKGGGIKGLEVFVDGVVEQTMGIEEMEADGATHTCSHETCTFDYSFVPDVTHLLSSGTHTLKVRVRDRANHISSRTREMTFDSRPPTLDVSLAPNPAPETPGGWFPQPSGLPVNFTASDNGDGTPGSGIAKVETVQPFVTNPQPLVLFSGEGCGSTENPCPQEAQGKKGLGTVPFFRQGEFEIPVRAYDVAGNVTTKTLTLRLDRSSPNATVTGPIFQAPLGTTIPADTEVDLAVTDKGSGIRELEVFVDGNVVQAMAIEEMEADGATQTCSHETCTLDYSFVPDVGDSLPSGIHTFEVRVKDRANRTSSRKREMMFDTHVPDLTLSGPLAESAGRDLEATSAELEIAASDVDAGLSLSGIASIAVTVDGEQVASLENCPDGSCAEPATMSYTYAEAEWGAGPHEVAATAFDRAGNAVVRRLMINESITAVAPVCPTGEQQVLASSDPISASEASTEIAASVPWAVAPTEPIQTEADKVDDESPFDPSVEDEGSSSINEQGFDVEGAPMGGGVEDAPAAAFTVGQAVCLHPLQTTTTETRPIEIGGDAVIYANSAPSTDTVVRPTAFGTTIVQHRRGPEAPAEFSWEIGLDPGEELRELPNGSVAVVGTGDLDFSDREIPPGAASLNPLDIADVDSQIVRAGASLAEATNEIEGEVITVISPPTVVKAAGSTTVGRLKISGGQIITASLPPDVIADAVAMIIEANTSPDPVAMCAHVFADTPNLYSDGCREPADPNAEPAPSAGEAVRLHQLALAALPAKLRADFARALDSGLGATASNSSPSAGDLDKAWCISHWERAVYCAYFNKDRDYAVSMEHRLFNFADTDNTKANAFKHALWVSAMLNSAPPDIEALRFAFNHEGSQRDSQIRAIRYRSLMDILNNYTAWVYAGERGRGDRESCEHFVSKVGPALFIDFNENPITWANRVRFQQNNLVYRRKLENGVRVHLVSQNCD